MQLRFVVPGPDAPGFLRRQRQALEFLDRFKSRAISAEVIDGLVAFLLPYVAEPEDREQAAEALLDASQNQFQEMLRGLTGSTAPLSAPRSEVN